MNASHAEPGAAQLFAECFDQPPAGVWHAPGRVNLIGEHTDYNDGFALPFALAAGVCVAAGSRAENCLAVSSRQQGGAVSTVRLGGLAPGSVRGWAAYPAGVAWALQASGQPVTGVNIAIDADLAPGAGLSSSAALECAVGMAMADLLKISLSRTQLAALGRRAENDFVGAPTGLMDQLAVMLGQAGHALLLDCRSGSFDAVPLPVREAGQALLIIDTRVQHELADGAYAARRRSCEAAAEALGVHALRDITDPGV